MSAPPRAAALLPMLLALAALALGACEPGPSPGGTFGVGRRGAPGPAGRARPAIAQIGDEVRPVPFARDATIVATVEAVVPRRGLMRAATGALPGGLEHGRLQLYWGPPNGTAFTRQRGRWRLDRHPRGRGRGKLVLEPPFADLETALALRVEHIPSMPRRLESEPFDLPPGTTVEIGYGLEHARVSQSVSSVSFTATLRCPWAWPRVLVNARVEGAAAGRWHDVSLRHERGGRGCRLVLEADSHGTDAGDALWSIPVLHLPATGDDTNVVLISLDTLRADHLSAYHYLRRTSPRIDEALVEPGTMFVDASTTFPMTHVAHLGVFTGRYPASLPPGGTLPAAAPIPMLTEILRDAGFATAGVTENGLVSAAYGFAWGFDRLVERYHAPIEGAERVFALGHQAVERLRDRRFFLFLHTYKVHDPYTPSEAFREFFPPSLAVGEHARVPEKHRAAFDDYDRCIRELDAHVGAFLDTLDALGLLERTVVVLLSDHGEAFGEHGIVGHGFSPRQEALRVPLVFRGPGIRAGHRVTTPVSLGDVLPTLLDLLGLPVPPGVQGRSLAAALAGAALPPHPVFFEWTGEGNVGMRSGSLKIERAGSGHRTFQLGNDPYEQAPKHGAAEDLVAQIAHYLEDGARRRAALDDVREPTTLSPEVHEALRALGYLR